VRSLSLEDVRTLLEAPSAAVLTTTRKDGTPLTMPVWFRWVVTKLVPGPRDGPA
jgi:hypothetical protein